MPLAQIWETCIKILYLPQNSSLFLWIHLRWWSILFLVLFTQNWVNLLCSACVFLRVSGFMLWWVQTPRLLWDWVYVRLFSAVNLTIFLHLCCGSLLIHWCLFSRSESIQVWLHYSNLHLCHRWDFPNLFRLKLRLAQQLGNSKVTITRQAIVSNTCSIAPDSKGLACEWGNPGSCQSPLLGNSLMVSQVCYN